MQTFICVHESVCEALARTHLGYADQKSTVVLQQIEELGFEQYIPVTVFP